MGQRSQAFIKATKNNQNIKLAAHHQWLFRFGFINRLQLLLNFEDSDFEYMRDGKYLIDALNFGGYSVQELKGKLNSSKFFTNGVSLNPFLQDNNNGQFFVDYDLKKFAIIAGPEDAEFGHVYSDKPEVISVLEYLENFDLNSEEKAEAEKISKEFEELASKNGWEYFQTFEELKTAFSDFYNDSK